MERTTRRRRGVVIAAGSIRDWEADVADIGRVVVGADDEGEVIDAAVDELRSQGAEVEVLPTGPWPQVARAVGEAVAAGRAASGLLACWTGTGTSMMANKVPGVRAALCWDPWIAEGARRWNDANVLVLSLKAISPEVARDVVRAWLSVAAPDADEAANIAELAAYEGEERHTRQDREAATGPPGDGRG